MFNYVELVAISSRLVHQKDLELNLLLIFCRDLELLEVPDIVLGSSDLRAA